MKIIILDDLREKNCKRNDTLIGTYSCTKYVHYIRIDIQDRHILCKQETRMNIALLTGMSCDNGFRNFAFQMRKTRR